LRNQTTTHTSRAGRGIAFHIYIKTDYTSNKQGKDPARICGGGRAVGRETAGLRPRWEGATVLLACNWGRKQYRINKSRIQRPFLVYENPNQHRRASSKAAVHAEIDGMKPGINPPPNELTPAAQPPRIARFCFFAPKSAAVKRESSVHGDD
jgi:hypothetical protein